MYIADRGLPRTDSLLIREDTDFESFIVEIKIKIFRDFFKIFSRFPSLWRAKSLEGTLGENRIQSSSSMGKVLPDLVLMRERQNRYVTSQKVEVQ